MITNDYQPRVLIIPSSYFATDRTVGGGERYALEYAKAMASLTPTTMALFDETPNRTKDGELEIRTFSIRHKNGKWWFPLTAESKRALKADYDIIHLMVFPTPATDTLLLLGRLYGKTIIGTDVGGVIPCTSTYINKLLPGQDLGRWLMHGQAPLSKHAATFFKHWKQPQTLLFGGVNLEMFSNQESRTEGYALYVGRLLEHKGILQVIQAIDNETPLHVVGRPYNDAYFKQLKEAAVGKKVTFLTDADDEELKRQYAGANVVLQPSIPTTDHENDKSELLGLVALEGMANSKPIIVTRTASLPELPIDGETGFIVPPHDLPAMAARIKELVNDPELSVRMGKAARQLIETKFTWNIVVERGLAFYKAVQDGTAK